MQFYPRLAQVHALPHHQCMSQSDSDNAVLPDTGSSPRPATPSVHVTIWQWHAVLPDTGSSPRPATPSVHVTIWQWQCSSTRHWLKSTPCHTISACHNLTVTMQFYPTLAQVHALPHHQCMSQSDSDNAVLPDTGSSPRPATPSVHVTIWQWQCSSTRHWLKSTPCHTISACHNLTVTMQFYPTLAQVHALPHHQCMSQSDNDNAVLPDTGSSPRPATPSVHVTIWQWQCSSTRHWLKSTPCHTISACHNLTVTMQFYPTLAQVHALPHHQCMSQSDSDNAGNVCVAH